MNVLVLALVAIGVAVAGQFLLRFGMTSATVNDALSSGDRMATVRAALLSPQVLLGLSLYFFSAVLWLGVLAKWDVSKAYPLVGLGFALSVAIGWMLGEPLSWSRVAGVGLICLGVALVGRS